MIYAKQSEDGIFFQNSMIFPGLLLGPVGTLKIAISLHAAKRSNDQTSCLPWQVLDKYQRFKI